MKITIQNTNMYVFNRNPLATLRTIWYRVKPWTVDSAGIQEGGEVTGSLRKLVFFKARFQQGDRHTSNNPILVRRSNKITGKIFWHAANGTGTKLTPPRNILAVKYKKRGQKIIHFNTHFHVVPEDRLAYDNPKEYTRVANQYKEQVELLFDLMRRYRRAGYLVFVTADGNARPWSGKKDWEFAAYKYLNQDGFKVLRHGVDIIVYDTDKVKNVELKTVPRALLGQADHDTMVMRCETK